jgi:nucleoside transporter
MVTEIAAAKITSAPPLDLLTRLRLSILMLLQFAVWGAWFVVFFPYLINNNFTPAQAGSLIGNMALGAILSTMVAGYVADRYFSSQNLMGVLHLLGAGLLALMAQYQSPDQYWPLFAASLAYALLYNPTLALANSIAFTHVPDATRDFPGIRVLGTVGWIAAGVSLGYLFGEEATKGNGPLLLAAALSAVLGVYSFTLPKTPPLGRAGDAIPFVKALGLFRDPSFAVFFLVSFGITIVLAFYYTTTGAFLESGAKVPGDRIGSTMAIGQVAELILLPFLPLFLYRLGMKWVLALGMFCWGLRYLLFAFGGPEGLAFALVIVGVALHGICFDFFFAAGFIHVDNQAPRDIRASGQALFSFLTYGVGMWLGNLTAGYLQGVYTDSSGTVNWQQFWLVPSIGVLVALVIFVLFFRLQPAPATTTTES